LWLHSLKVAQLLRSAACLHTNQSRSYLNHLVCCWAYGSSGMWPFIAVLLFSDVSIAPRSWILKHLFLYRVLLMSEFVCCCTGQYVLCALFVCLCVYNIKQCVQFMLLSRPFFLEFQDVNLSVGLRSLHTCRLCLLPFILIFPSCCPLARVFSMN